MIQVPYDTTLLILAREGVKKPVSCYEVIFKLLYLIRLGTLTYLGWLSLHHEES